MSGQVAAVTKERVFGANGETVEEIERPVEEVEQEEPEEIVNPEDDKPDKKDPPPLAATNKYRIGDKMFATQAEAYAYAETYTPSSPEADALRQVVREIATGVPRAESVTIPVKPTLNAEEMYTNPDEFIAKLTKQIKSDTISELSQSQAVKDDDVRVWREFTDRHPDLADFRDDITGLVARLQPEVQGVSRNKGAAAAYDYVATKFKAQVERQAAALRPKRALPNNGGQAPAGGKAETVTSTKGEKKPLSFDDQLRMLRKKHR